MGLAVADDGLGEVEAGFADFPLTFDLVFVAGTLSQSLQHLVNRRADAGEDGRVAQGVGAALAFAQTLH